MFTGTARMNEDYQRERSQFNRVKKNQRKRTIKITITYAYENNEYVHRDDRVKYDNEIQES